MIIKKNTFILPLAWPDMIVKDKRRKRKKLFFDLLFLCDLIIPDWICSAMRSLSPNNEKIIRKHRKCVESCWNRENFWRDCTSEWKDLICSWNLSDCQARHQVLSTVTNSNYYFYYFSREKHSTHLSFDEQRLRKNYYDFNS